MKHHATLLVITSSVALLALSSCTTTSTPADGNQTKSPAGTPLTVRYHPYGPSLDHRLAKPQPPFSGLTDRRIDVDARLIRSTQIRTVVICLDPQTLADNDRLARVKTLLSTFTADNPPSLAVVLQIEKGSLTADQLTQAISTLRSFGLHSLKGYRQHAGEPVIEFRGTLPPGYAPPPGLILQRAPEPTNRLANGLSLDQSGRTAFVAAAKHDGNHWHVDRTPREFARRLKKATASGAQEIRVDAWNDFAAGAFLQPNRLDGRDLLDVIR